jgi:single-strand DNA-binding protein
MDEIAFHSAANLTRDPDLRFTPGGRPVASLGLAITPRRYDSATKAYVDGATTFIDASVWGAQAEHVAESLHSGDRVIVSGRLITRVFTPNQGRNAGVEQRRFEVVVTEIGPSLRWAQTQTTKVTLRLVEPPVEDEPPM